MNHQRHISLVYVCWPCGDRRLLAAFSTKLDADFFVAGIRRWIDAEPTAPEPSYDQLELDPQDPEWRAFTERHARWEDSVPKLAHQCIGGDLEITETPLLEPGTRLLPLP